MTKTNRPMKDSGIEWIGEIPKNWDLPKVKQLFYIGRGRVISQLDLEDSGYPVYSSQTKNNGCLGYIKTYDFDRSQLTWTTDGANAGTVFLREGKHNCTNVCGTLMPKTENNNLVFLKFALEYIATFHKRADINGYKIMNNEMAEIRVVLPPLEEQQKIAEFLDEKCSHIDSVLDKTKASIEEYKKLKQAVITQAVSKGIRPNRPMKDSGITWIGEIPEDWRVNTVFQLFTQVKNKNEGLIEQNLLSLSYGKLKRKSIETVGGLLPESFDGYNIIEENDIVLRLTDLQNDHKSLRVGLANERGIITSAYVTIRNRTLNIPQYLYYYLHSFDIAKGFYGMGAGVRQGLNWDGLKWLKITIPNKAEQIEIVNYLNDKCTEIDKLIEKKEQLISELETYKKSLIYEYVTGKKEVC